jgi:hypothetical protein
MQSPVAAPTAVKPADGGGPQYIAQGTPQHDAAAHAQLASIGLPDNYSPGSFDNPPAQDPSRVSPFDSDPGYAGAKAAENLGIPSIENQLKNLISQRIVAYGDPALAAQAGFGLDPQAAAFARQNYLSGNGQLARLDKAHEQARRAIINQLAAHGLIDSGDTGYQIGNADQSYGNQVYDAQQQALADILGYRNDAQSREDALRNAKVAALENAFTNYSNNPAAYGQTGQQTAAGASGATAASANAVQAWNPAAAVKSVVAAAKPRQAVMRQLVNPYTTGRKRRG